MKNLVIQLGVLCLLFLSTGCTTTEQKQKEPKKIKNLILLIGDGMGPQQIGLLESYAKLAPNSIYQGQNSALSSLANNGFTGLSNHYPSNALVVDSACSATQIATGVASNSEMIGLNQYGETVLTILERAKAQGKSTGLISDTRLTHATPAAFAAHQIHRSLENRIAEQMVLGNQVDVMLSGGLRHFIPKEYQLTGQFDYENALKQARLSLKSKRHDDKNILKEAEALGYELSFNREQLLATKKDKVLGLFANSAMQDGVATRYQRNAEPNLTEMAKVALDKLANNPNGFFLMVEGGQIDWAGHNNDAGTLLHEMLKFDDMVKHVLAFAKERDDTLVVVTADHETGGFGFSYSGVNLPKAVQLDNDNQDTFKPSFNFGDVSILDKLYQQSQSYNSMWYSAAGTQSVPTKNALMAAINQHSAFKVSSSDIDNILNLQENTMQVGGHKALDRKLSAKINDFSPFYVYIDQRPLNLIGRALSTQQNIVWSTGTHTHTPVPVFAFGPTNHAKHFSGFYHHLELGKKMQKVFINDAN